MISKKLKIQISTGQVIGLIAVLIFVLFLIYIRIFPSKYRTTVIYNDPQNYIGIFNDSTRKHLKLDATTISNQHNPLVEYTYDERFHVQIFKIGNIADKSLNNLIVENVTGLNNYGSFDGITSGDCDVLYRIGEHEIHKLYLEIHGKDITIERNSDEKYLLYTSDLSNFIISYTKNGDAYICGETGRHLNYPTNDSCELLFLKKNNFLYFIFIAPEVKDAWVNPGTLQAMLN